MTYAYKYEVDPSLSESLLQKGEPEIRFCKCILSANRLFSKKELKEISEVLGYDVIKDRGGNGCIHIWTRVRQVV